MSISVQNISKTFKDKTALKNISFEVKEGELFGLIGPDGAGKTTLFRILTTLLFADSGTATVANFDAIDDYKKIRNPQLTTRLGYCCESVFALCNSGGENAPAHRGRTILCFRQTRRIRAPIYQHAL